MYRHDKPTKNRPLPFVLFEPPFTSISTVTRGHPSLACLVVTYKYNIMHGVFPSNHRQILNSLLKLEFSAVLFAIMSNTQIKKRNK
jgi:hypothetical protein